MNKYRKVFKPRENVVKDETEIRVTAAGSVSAYVSRAATIFNELEKSKLTITATGNALTKAVTSAEVIKRRFKGLHQITKVINQEIVDEYEPLEEGLDPVSETRNIACMEIQLSKDELDKDDKGYQEPIDEDLVKEIDPEEITKSRGTGRGRGKGKGKGKGKDKGKGKGKDKGKSKSKSKGKGDSKGKGKDKSKGKDKGKSKSRDRDYSDSGYGGKSKSKGKGKGKGKGSKGKSESKGWGSNYYDSGYKSEGYGGYKSGYNSYNSYPKSKGKGGGGKYGGGKSWNWSY